MATIFDVSKAILKNFPFGISSRKLQKLAYYAQGWHLAITGKPLFQEDFEAWQHGPVCPELFRRHRRIYSVDEHSFSEGYAGVLTKAERFLVDEIIVQKYGAFSGDTLSEMTHTPGSPWDKTRKEAGATPQDPCTAVIDKKLIKEYFENLLPTSDQ